MNFIVFVSILLLVVIQVQGWSFYDLAKNPVTTTDLTATVKATKDTLFTTQGAFTGVTLGDLSRIQAKIVVARTNENSHTHNNDVFSVVFEGAGTMNTLQRAMFAGSGDSFVVPANTLHFTVNHKNVSLDATADAARDYVVFLSSFSPQPYSRTPQATSLQPTTPPPNLSTSFRSGTFRSIEGANRDVKTGSVNTFVKHLISTNTSTTALLNLKFAYPIYSPFDSLYVVMEGSATLKVNGQSLQLGQKDIFMVPNNTLGLITPSRFNRVKLMINTSPSFPLFN